MEFSEKVYGLVEDAEKDLAEISSPSSEKNTPARSGNDNGDNFYACRDYRYGDQLAQIIAKARITVFKTVDKIGRVAVVHERRNAFRVYGRVVFTTQAQPVYQRFATAFIASDTIVEKQCVFANLAQAFDWIIKNFFSARVAGIPAARRAVL